jgi:ABC-type transporter Mla subunit MlaD
MDKEKIIVDIILQLKETTGIISTLREQFKQVEQIIEKIPKPSVIPTQEINLEKNFSKIKEELKDFKTLFKDLENTFSSSFKNIIDNFNKALEKSKTDLIEINKILSEIKSNQKINLKFKLNTEELNKDINSSLGIFNKIFTESSNVIKNINKEINLLENNIRKLPGILGNLNKIGKTNLDLGFLNKIENNINKATKGFNNLGNILDNLNKRIDILVNNLKNYLNELNNFINNLNKNLKVSINNIFKDNTKGLKNNLEKDFKQAVSKASNGIKELSNSIKETDKGMKNFYKTKTKTEENLGGEFHNTLGRLTLAFFGLSFGLSRIEEIFRDLIKTLFEVSSEYEFLNKQIIGLLGSISLSEKVWNELLNLTIQTPFTLREISEGFRDITASTGDFKLSLDLIKASIGTAIVFGTDLSSLLLNIGRAIEGDAQAWKNLRHSIVLTNPKIKELGGVLDSSGRLILSQEEALKKNIEALKKYIESYKDAASTQMGTFKQILSNLEDVRDIIVLELNKELFNLTKLILNSIQNIGVGFGKLLKENQGLATFLGTFSTYFTIIGSGATLASKSLGTLSDAMIVFDSLIVLSVFNRRGLVRDFFRIFAENLLNINRLLQLVGVGIRLLGLSLRFLFLNPVSLTILALSVLVQVIGNIIRKQEELRQKNFELQNTLKDLKLTNEGYNKTFNELTKAIIDNSKEVITNKEALKELEKNFLDNKEAVEALDKAIKKLSDEELKDLKEKIQSLKFEKVFKEETEGIFKELERFKENVGDIGLGNEVIKNLEKDLKKKKYGKDEIEKIKQTLKDVRVLTLNIDFENIEVAKEKIKKIIEDLKRISKTAPLEPEQRLNIQNLIKGYKNILDILENYKNKQQEFTKQQEEINKRIENEIKLRQQIQEEIKQILENLEKIRLITFEETGFREVISLLETGEKKFNLFSENLEVANKQFRSFSDELNKLTLQDKFSFYTLENSILGLNNLTSQTIINIKNVIERSRESLQKQVEELVKNDDVIKNFLNDTKEVYSLINQGIQNALKEDNLDKVRENIKELEGFIQQQINITKDYIKTLEQAINSGLLPEDKKREYLKFLDAAKIRLENLINILGKIKAGKVLEIKQKMILEEELEKRRKEEEERRKELEKFLKDIKEMFSAEESFKNLTSLLEDIKTKLTDIYNLEDLGYNEINKGISRLVFQGEKVKGIGDIIDKLFVKLEEVFKDNKDILEVLKKAEKKLKIDILIGLLGNLSKDINDILEKQKGLVESFKQKVEKYLGAQKKTDEIETEIQKQREKISKTEEKLTEAKKEKEKATTKEEAEEADKKIKTLDASLIAAKQNLGLLSEANRTFKSWERSVLFWANILEREKRREGLEKPKEYKSLEEIPEDILEKVIEKVGKYQLEKVNELLGKVEKNIEETQKQKTFQESVVDFGSAVDKFVKSIDNLKEIKVKIETGKTETTQTITTKQENNLNPYVK